MSHLVDHGDQLDRQHTAEQPSPGTTRALIYRAHARDEAARDPCPFYLLRPRRQH